MPPKFYLCPLNFVVPRTLFIKTYNKNKNVAPLKMHFAPQNLKTWLRAWVDLRRFDKDLDPSLSTYILFETHLYADFYKAILWHRVDHALAQGDFQLCKHNDKPREGKVKSVYLKMWLMSLEIMKRMLREVLKSNAYRKSTDSLLHLIFNFVNNQKVNCLDAKKAQNI